MHLQNSERSEIFRLAILTQILLNTAAYALLWKLMLHLVNSRRNYNSERYSLTCMIPYAYLKILLANLYYQTKERIIDVFT